MPTITIKPTVCTESPGWKTLYYYQSTNSSHYPRRINFTFPTDNRLSGSGTVITQVKIIGSTRNTSSSPKNLRWGLKPELSSNQTSWLELDGSIVIGSKFRGADSASHSGRPDYFSPSQTYPGSHIISKSIKDQFKMGNDLYLGVIEPSSSTSIQVDTRLESWSIVIDYDILGNIPSNNVTSAILGSTAITTTVSKIVPDSTTTLRYKINDNIVHEADLDVGTTHTWTPPIDCGRYFPDSMTGVLNIESETYVNGAPYGTVSSSVELTLPSLAKPSCTASLVRLWNTEASPSNRPDIYIQSITGVKVTLNGVGMFGATINSYSASIENKVYSAKEFSHLSFISSGTITLSYTVTDSRGLSASFSEAIQVVPYRFPSIQTFSIYRVNSDMSDAIDGTYALAHVSASVSSLMSDGQERNKLSFFVKFRELVDDDSPIKDWSVTDTVSSSSINNTFRGLLTQNGVPIGGGGIDPSGKLNPFNDMSGYEFQIEVHDLFTVSTAMDQMPTKVTHWDIDEITGSMGFGGEAPKSTESVGYKFYEKIEALKGFISEGLSFGWHAGDVFDIVDRTMISGQVSNGGKGLYMSFNVGMPIFANTVTISGQMVVRGTKGYVDNMSYATGITFPSSSFSVESTIPSKKAGIVEFVIRKETTYENITNNTPIVGEVKSLKLTFS